MCKQKGLYRTVIMVRTLATDLPVQSAYYGFMFSVHATEDLEIVALHAMSEVNIKISAKLYATKTGTWETFKADKSAWQEVAEGTFAERRVLTRIALPKPVQLRSGETKSFYIHTSDLAGVGFNTDSSAVSSQDSYLQIMAGAPTGSDKPFTNVSQKSNVFICHTPTSNFHVTHFM